MRTTSLLAAVALLAACATPQASSPLPLPAPGAPSAAALPPEDPYLWLEDVTGERPLAWVSERNAASTNELESAPGYEALRARLKAIYDSKDRIPFPGVMGGVLYNFWEDDQHPRGLWRRTSMAEFKKAAPKWETVLDVDALGAQEGKSWVWHGASCLKPAYQRCLVTLSLGGSDAHEVREFDVVKKAFVPGGFSLPEAKSTVAWKDLDTLYVGTDFGPGTLTTSGYPRQLREWRRGTPLAEATLVFEGQAGDMSVSGSREWDHGHVRDWVVRTTSFFADETFLRDGGRLVKLDKPGDAVAGTWDDQLLLQLRTDWTVGGRTWKGGSLLVTPLADFLAGKRDFHALFVPTATTALAWWSGTRTALLLTTLEDVKTVISTATRGKGGWTVSRLDLPSMGTYYAVPWDTDSSDDYFLDGSSYTTPTSLFLGTVGKKGPGQVLKQQPAFFDAAGVEATQHFATSKDGTRVPYFQVARQGSAPDGEAPTLLSGYGGFEVSLTPEYDATSGAAWIERGGTYVVANIRGGGEYGPAWHQAALTRNRQRAYDDFAAVAEDLVARKVTRPGRLGIMGGSNGGLLVGVMLTQRPELFGAVVCEVPLLDMRRYHRLLAGASWMEEYGDPDEPADWAALSKYSPYQNVRAGVRYPRTLFTTSTRDDRVHPGHARKMVARLLEHGADLLYFENVEGGHSAGADNAQRARLSALAWTFLARQLGLGDAAPPPASASRP